MWTVKYDVQNTVWEAGGLEDRADGPEAAWGHFRAFENAGVASRDGVGHGPETEDEGSIPKNSIKNRESLGEKERGKLKANT